jgi:hypothetical protein
MAIAQILFTDTVDEWVNKTNQLITEVSDLSSVLSGSGGGAVFGGDVTINGTLQVQGDTVSIVGNEVNIGDQILVLNANEAGAPTQDSGFEIERGTSPNVSMIWDEANDKWVLSGGNLLIEDGTFELGGSGGSGLITTGHNYSIASEISYAASITPDFRNSNVFEITLTGDIVANNPILYGNNPEGMQITIIIKQDAAGGHNITFGTDYLFSQGVAPAITSTANAIDVFSFIVDTNGKLLGVHQYDFR